MKQLIALVIALSFIGLTAMTADAHTKKHHKHHHKAPCHSDQGKHGK